MKTHPVQPTSSRHHKRAFSLAEVTLSLAIASLGFLSLVGLLPQGLAMAKQATDIGATSRISQKIGAEVLSTPWDKLSKSGYGEKRYFDDQGVETVNSDPFLSYIACVCIPAENKDVLLPSNGGASPSAEQYVRRVRIYVKQTSAPDFSFEEDMPYTSIKLAQMGQ